MRERGSNLRRPVTKSRPELQPLIDAVRAKAEEGPSDELWNEVLGLLRFAPDGPLSFPQFCEKVGYESRHKAFRLLNNAKANKPANRAQRLEIIDAVERVLLGTERAA